MHELTSLSDRASLRAAIEAEAALDYDIQIGGKLSVKKQIDPIQLKAQLDRVRLYSLLFGELKRLLHEVDFGAGTEAAYSEGRRRIVERMQSLNPDQQVRFDALLADVETLPPAQLQAQLRQQLYQLLDASDWQTITATALSAVESKLLKQIAPV